ncbi:uncharacterized protein N0V89_003129 [Didymosphaeria variabile]|uniref:Uncharacterized protein n=1 Tax=Didymosphaeria variabile TaxID=1932322 RepID=A0A9W8XVJ0_9PLEO|nr:uncharacterized protein N0V89_003129 [Didymosphaeria variabile]KAJ4358545.1 hypothetical protein N0V89_003129 [Didymosphaeria variabile]
MSARRTHYEMLTATQIAIIVIIIFVILLVTYLLTRKLRRQSGVPTRKPKDKLPSLFSWKNLRIRPRRNEYSTSLQDQDAGRNSNAGTNRDREMTGSVSVANDPERQSLAQNSNTNANAGVDRNTSVRSVMTLPPYAPAARENEQVLGREGERGGIDTVVEFPEDIDEEESRREGEMESLYQIRLARRQEARDREERRQARREARQRGDYEALAEIRRRAEQAADESVSALLIATHQTSNRDRRVSSVQYGDLGVARHDGTRLRANSTDSDNRPLLDSAASFGSSGRARGMSSTTLSTHQRGLSASSLRSVSTGRASEEYEFPPEATTTHRSNSDDFEVVSLSHPQSNSNPHSRNLSRVTTPNPAPSIEIPNEDAPAYEDPPIYESPIATRAPQLPGAPQLPTLERLPSIHITPEPTPLDGREPLRDYSPASR